MPGIAGIISQRPAAECQALVKAMVAAMAYESFYRSGTHFIPELGIYGGWVASENSFAANQIFLNEQQDIALIFSGEIFLDAETGAGLKQKGHRLDVHKASWLVHLYEEEGQKFFEKLNGLFSGLLIDRRHGKAFLFNDRYGFQRIYFHEGRDAIYFASEAKALLRVLPELRGFDAAGVAQFLAVGCTLDGRTLFRGVQSLPGGSCWTFENGNCRHGKYFSPEIWESQPTLAPAEFESQLEATFKRILPRYFASDAKIGVALTGGLDSRMVMAGRPPDRRDQICYTYSGTHGETWDDKIAARVAAACGLEHKLLRLQPDFFPGFATHADRTVFVTDGCFGITGAHEIYFNRQARQLSPVRLTGVFGSEVLRGVSTFKPIKLSPGLVAPELLPAIESSARQLTGVKQHPVGFAVFKEIPWNIFGSVRACQSQVDFRTPYLDNELVALAYRTPASLQKSAAAAFRFVKKNDAVLGRIPTDMGYAGDDSGSIRRAFLKVTFKLDYLCNDGLPHWLSPFDPFFDRLYSGSGILGTHKYLRYRRWLRGALAGYLNDALADAQRAQSPFWNVDFLKQMAAQHISGRKNYLREINAVLTLRAVERLLF
ncbi:MAG TPA: asparagine synthase-related protein [Verrucomicrobiae bacterium]